MNNFEDLVKGMSTFTPSRTVIETAILCALELAKWVSVGFLIHAGWSLWDKL